jgi:drug/metabolite transporter (DMT)-like permease
MATECTTAAAVRAEVAPASGVGAFTWRIRLELTLLGAVWGGSFLFMRLAAADFGALPLVETRLALGAVVLLPFLWRERARFTPALWLRISGIAAINSAAPYVLFAWGAERAPAGIGAITNAMTVMFTALVAFLLFGERISARRLAALTAGFAGVVILASGKTQGASVWAAALAGAAAALLYGLGINLVRRHLTGYPPAAVAAVTLICAAAQLLPFAAWTWPRHPLPAVAVLSAVLLGVLCTGVAFVFYYRLIARVGATRASTVTYLIPLFGVLWAWLVLGEPLTISMALAAAVILGGVAFSQQPQRSL